MTQKLNLEAVGVQVGKRGHVVVDEYQNTSVANVYAVGDVCGILDLTPMAIAAGRRLADRLFNNMAVAKADYENVPSVVFAHPTIGTCGLTEPQAIAKYGEENIKIFESNFVNLYYATFCEGNVGDKPVTKYKLICLEPQQTIVGLHMIGKYILY
jgi:glutathione reductase (NADPH)